MKWIRLCSREGVDITLTESILVVFYDYLQDFTGEKGELMFSHFRNKTFTHYMKVVPQECGRFLYQKYLDSIDNIMKYYKDGEKLQERFLTYEMKLTEDSSNEEFLKALEEFKDQFKIMNYDYSIMPFVAIEAWQNDFEKIVSDLVKKNNLEDKQDKILQTVYSPWKKTALCEIQDLVKKGVPASQIVKDYQFLRNWAVIWYRPIDEEWVNGIAVQEQEEKEVYTISEVISLLKPNEREKHFLSIAPYMIFFKDYRDDIRRKHIYVWSFYFELLAKKFGIEYDDLGYLSIDEMEKFLQEKVDIDLINERKKGGRIVAVADFKTTITKGIPDKYKEIMDEIKDKEKSLEVKGLVAYKGKVRGKVIIVRSFHDIKKVSDGDILVTNTTHPNYLPAMQRAAAFVTNEGGVASHAAIVSRELKKPCIVATKHATKVLDNGMIVEVDADNGVVRKIE